MHACSQHVPPHACMHADTRGAIAVATWSCQVLDHHRTQLQQQQQQQQPQDRSDRTASASASTSPSLMVDFKHLDIKLFDMPCATVTLARKKSKATGKASVRRQGATQPAPPPVKLSSGDLTPHLAPALPPSLRSPGR
jgi:hypothetical protein